LPQGGVEFRFFQGHTVSCQCKGEERIYRSPSRAGEAKSWMKEGCSFFPVSYQISSWYTKQAILYRVNT
jgi:hypothetical protein